MLLEDSDYGRDAGKIFESVVKAKGAEIVTTEYFKLGETDFYAQLSKIKDANPDAIFAVGSITEYALILKQAHEIGLWKQFVGLGGIASDEFLEMAKDDACLLYTSPSPRDLSTSRMPSSA